MERRQLGTSDLKVSPIIFGAWAIGGWLWGGTDDDEAIRAIHASLDAGVNTIDTAPVYGFGHSEEIVGKAIKGRREKVIVATKCGPRWTRTDGVFSMNVKLPDGREAPLHRVLKRDSILEECDMSLKRLGVEAIDLYQCHWPDTTTPMEESMEALLKLKDEGKIRHIGVSNFPAELIGKSLSLGPIVSDQPRYNLIKREIEKDVLPFCRKHGVGVIAYSPMEHGLLSGKVTMDRTFKGDDLRVKHPWYKPENRKRVIEALETVRPIAEAHGVSLAQMAVNWVISEPGVTAAIVGTRNPKQAVENARAASFKLRDDERAFLRKTFEELGQPA